MRGQKTASSKARQRAGSAAVSAKTAAGAGTQSSWARAAARSVAAARSGGIMAVSNLIGPLDELERARHRRLREIDTVFMS
jgi:hypothetical protein